MDKSYTNNLIQNLIKHHYDILEPSTLKTLFTTNEEFIEWLKLGTKEDLQCMVSVFENFELFEDCLVIHNVLKTKQ